MGEVLRRCLFGAFSKPVGVRGRWGEGPSTTGLPRRSGRWGAILGPRSLGRAATPAVETSVDFPPPSSLASWAGLSPTSQSLSFFRPQETGPGGRRRASPLGGQHPFARGGQSSGAPRVPGPGAARQAGFTGAGEARRPGADQVRGRGRVVCAGHGRARRAPGLELPVAAATCPPHHETTMLLASAREHEHVCVCVWCVSVCAACAVRVRQPLHARSVVFRRLQVAPGSAAPPALRRAQLCSCPTRCAPRPGPRPPHLGRRLGTGAPSRLLAASLTPPLPSLLRSPQRM